MDDLSSLDEDFSRERHIGNFQHGRIAGETFHLEHVLQTHAPQHATETFLRAMLYQFAQNTVKTLPAVGVGGFFEIKFRAIAQTGRAIFLVGESGEDNFLDVWVTAIE